jgi:RNA polymerase sigma-70 factor (ECF subfamily)
MGYESGGECKKLMLWESDAPDRQAEEEARLLMLARDKPTAFAPLYERYFPRIYAYCLRRVGSTEEAEDLTSLIFTRALTGIRSYRGGSVVAWLFRIAHNAVANHLRDRRPQLPLDTAAHPLSGEDLSEGLVRAEEQLHLARLLAALPTEQREIVLLRLVGELTAKEIGAVIGKREGAVRVALHRIIHGLRAAYQQANEEVLR